MILQFNSTHEEVCTVKQTFNEVDIKKETMLFSADYEFARKNGDGLTNLFLDNMPEDWKQSKLIIDTRLHMLMPGWCPCVPGWHHDDVPRAGRFGQPNYINPEYYSEHLLMIVNADIAPTEFYGNKKDSIVTLELPEELIYSHWSKELNKRIEHMGKLGTDWITKVKDSTIYRFTWETFHRGVPAVGNGWRFFIRASRYWDDKEMTIPNHSRVQRRTGKNEIRRQVQVYLPDYEKGW